MQNGASFGAVPSDEWPAWPAVYLSCTSLGFLLLSAVRLWQLRKAISKVKYASIYHIKVVCTCFLRDNGWTLQDVDYNLGHFTDLPGIAIDRSHQRFS